MARIRTDRIDTSSESKRISLMDETRLIDVPTVAEWLQVSSQWVYRHWRKLGGKKLGAQIRFIEKEIVERVKGLN